MAIFILDPDPKINVQLLGDKHLTQAILTSAVALSTALHNVGCHESYLYNSLAPKSSFNKWVAATKENFQWLLNTATYAGEEFLYRKERMHRSYKDVILLIKENNLSSFIPNGKLQPFLQNLPEKYKQENTVQAYRNFYKEKKAPNTHWTKREKPNWLK